MKLTKFDGCRNAVFIKIPGEGMVERGFRNQGEAINWLERNYGKSWKKLSPKFLKNINQE